jgi:hypothetical protein
VEVNADIAGKWRVLRLFVGAHDFEGPLPLDGEAAAVAAAAAATAAGSCEERDLDRSSENSSPPTPLSCTDSTSPGAAAAPAAVVAVESGCIGLAKRTQAWFDRADTLGMCFSRTIPIPNSILSAITAGLAVSTNMVSES